MNAVQAVAAPDRRISKTELYASEVLPRDSQVLHTLPAGIDPERFKNSLHIALMMNPALLNCHPSYTLREVARAANHGLSLDPSLGEAWLVVRKNRDGRPEPQMQLGYRGKMRLARQSGEVARIVAYPVTQKSVMEGRFKVTLRELHYEPDVFNDDSPVVGYFAFVEYKDGTEDHETMSLREIYQIRDRSDAWKAFKKGSIKSTPWSDYEGEMCKKTVLSRLMKRVPMSADLVKFLREDEAADYADVEDAPPSPALAPPRRGRPPGSRTAALQEIAAPKAPKNKPATGPDESETEEEQPSESVDIPDDPQDDAPEIREPDNGPDESFIVDTTSPDYARGMRDFHAGLKKCVKGEILQDEKRLANWQAGWDDARDGVEEATNGREDT